MDHVLNNIHKIWQIANPLSLDEFFLKIKEIYESKDFEILSLFLGDLARFPCFLELREMLNDEEYFQFLGQCLVSECYATDFPDGIRTCLESRPIKFRKFLMSTEEQECFNNLPDEIVIFRGCAPGCVKGFSWTLSLDRARFFADRHKNLGSDSGVFQGKCKKSDVIAYFAREEEIFLFPENVLEMIPIDLMEGTKVDVDNISLYKYTIYIKLKEIVEDNFAALLQK